MKNHYQVKVRETYSKFVDVYVDDIDHVDDEIATMQESGEIEWDSANDFDGWEIMGIEQVGYADWEIRNVKKWCWEMVAVTAIVDPEWIEDGMDEHQCMDWLEQMRDRGVSVPDEATSSDLWDAVQAYRRGDMKYGK